MPLLIAQEAVEVLGLSRQVAEEVRHSIGMVLMAMHLETGNMDKAQDIFQNLVGSAVNDAS